MATENGDEIRPHQQLASCELARQNEAEMASAVNARTTTLLAEGETAKARLTESESYLKTLLDILPVGIIAVDAENHRIVEINSFASRLAGRDAKDVVGEVCHGFICPAEVGRCLITDLGKTVDQSERVLLAEAGGKIPVLKTVSRVNRGGRTVLIESFVDLRAVKAKEAAEAANKAKSEFLASCFHFNAQFGLPAASTQQSRPVAPEGLGGLSVLVVDDNASNLDLLCEFLSAWGMQPTAVSSGGSALAAIKNGPLPLVLIDADLPDMNGRAVARRIKDTTEPAPAIIVMLSTRDRQGDSPRMPELGGAGLLTKPITQADLLDAIQKVLGVLQPTENGGLRKRASSEAQFELRRWNILLAEDNSVNQLVTSRILQKRGCSVSIVSDGLEAVQTFERQHFDMILMDVRMPLMGGLEAAALIREKECSTGGRVPIVALTADATLGCREQCLNAGMDDYLSKPINPQRLLAKLDRLLLAPTDALDCQKTQQRLV